MPLRKPTICIVTCYHQPDYIRAVTLRKGLVDSDVFQDVIVIKNRHTGIRRYTDVLIDLIKIRLTKNPDTYLITFRAYEILPFVLAIGYGKKIIYDEFINPVEWFVYEHKYFSGRLAFLGTALRRIFTALMRRTSHILTDTASHADYSSHLMNIPRDHYASIPVATDESVFRPLPTIQPPADTFTVLYYSSVLPLHGVQYVLDAAVLLSQHADITFRIIGGKQPFQLDVQAAIAKGAHIVYEKWVDYDKLPEAFAKSNLCIGGPFGDTLQSRFVITGKTYQILSSAKPVLVGKNQETALFTDKKNALVVPQADAQAIADAVLWAYDNPKKLDSIAREGSKLYTAHLSSKRVAADLRHLFVNKHIF